MSLGWSRLSRTLLLGTLLGPFGLAAHAATTDELDFNQAVSRIIERSTSVAAQRATLNAQMATGLVARLFYLPNIDLIGKRARVGSEFDPDSYGNEATLRASLNLFRFGGDLAAWSAAHSDETAEQAQLLSETLKAEQDAVEALVGFISVAQEVEVSKKSFSLQTDLIRVGRARYERGLLPMQEIDKLSIDLENLRSNLSDAEVRLAEASARLESALGGPRVQAIWPWKKMIIAPKGEIENRPDLQVARARLDAEAQRYRLKISAALPTFDLNTSYSYTNGALRAGREDGKSWAGALTVNIPIFDRLSGYSAAKAQGYLREAAESRLEQVRRSAWSDLQAAQGSFKISRSSVIAREKALELSGTVYSDSLKRFKLGRLDANALTLDQSRVLSAELNAVHGWATLHTTASRLCHAQGLRLGDCLTTVTAEKSESSEPGIHESTPVHAP